MTGKGGERREGREEAGAKEPTAKPRQFSLTEEDGEPVYLPEPENKGGGK